MHRYFREGWAFARPNLCFFFGTALMWILVLVLTALGLWCLFVAAGWEKPRDYSSMDGEETDPQTMKAGFFVAAAIRSMPCSPFSLPLPPATFYLIRLSVTELFCAVRLPRFVV